MASSPTEKHHDKISLEESQLAIEVQPPPYTIFNRYERILYAWVSSVAAFASPVSTSIYYPALTVLATDLDTSLQNINISITTYMVGVLGRKEEKSEWLINVGLGMQIFQAIAPTFVGGISDRYGRRPAYFICFIVSLFNFYRTLKLNQFDSALIYKLFLVHADFPSHPDIHNSQHRPRPPNLLPRPAHSPHGPKRRKQRHHLANQWCRLRRLNSFPTRTIYRHRRFGFKSRSDTGSFNRWSFSPFQRLAFHFLVS